MELSYADLAEEIEKMLKEQTGIILATCADNKVTARMMCPLNEGLDILFSTNGGSDKVRQIKSNPNVALAIGNMQVEAVAEIFGHPDDHPTFSARYAEKYPQLAGKYESSPSDVLVIVRPAKITLYKYIGGPCEDVLYVEEKRAVRISLS